VLCRYPKNSAFNNKDHFGLAQPRPNRFSVLKNQALIHLDQPISISINRWLSTV